MHASICTTASSEQSALASRLIAATAVLLDARDFGVDELRTSTHDAVVAVAFALSGLPRRVVDAGLGEVFFNEDASYTDRGGCDGDLVAMIEFDGRHAVLDAARGHAEYDADNDAYLNGVAYVFGNEHEARRFAEACSLKVRRRAVAAALRRALDLAWPLPANVAVGIMAEAFDDKEDPERRAWLHTMRWFIGHPELEVIRRL